MFAFITAHESFANLVKIMEASLGTIEMAFVNNWTMTDTGCWQAMERSITRDGLIMKPLEDVYITFRPSGIVRASRWRRIGCGRLATMLIICSESPGCGDDVKLKPYEIWT